ncbi:MULTISPECIES: hypothetical protein [Staphylococcus]|uniref:hypothetical protein n=1 Tax=Staphylococcus TaxID=1279 RepID=UPI0005979822|nr:MULTISPECIES: hypothetical protein [Staphylococcus]KIJ87101.1 hypothetical protein SE00_05475 [Staphylococcus saprophyticus]MDW4414156.1 hypothetical protein [Staphylococcus saprophyticus]RXS18625.1 hypothetical protein EUA51_10945 [Staphylococcus saprophyticus]SUM76470.1 Uncharacterised protein [Staphylococcus saprophyticus]
MKKLLFLLLSCFLVLAACSHSEEKHSKNTKESHSDKSQKTKSNKKIENKDQPNNQSKTEDANSDEQPSSEPASTQNEQNEVAVSTEEPSNEIPSNVTPDTAEDNQVQQPTQTKQQIDLNSMPATDFSTDRMSEEAQQQIQDLTKQKDFEGLPQEEYNDKVSEIMNNEMN